MSLLKNLKSEGLEAQEDRLGGGFARKSTGLYPAKIKLAYISKSTSSKAMAVNFTFDINGQEYRESPIWITNGEGDNFYYTKDEQGNRTKNKAQLPGFNLVNNLCRLAVDKELSELDTEEKTVKIYDFDEKKELPKSVDCITELHGSMVLLAIVEQTVNKTEKNDNTGKYEPIADSRDENVIEHVFHLETRATVNELEGNKPFEFANQWEEKYAGKKRDKRTIKDGESAPKSGRPTSSGGNAPASGGEKKTSSLFNRNK